MSAGGTADTAVITAIAGLATNLGMSTVAEGVETVGQRDQLVALGCDVLQGFLYSRPVAADRMTAMLARGRVEMTPAKLAA